MFMIFDIDQSNTGWYLSRSEISILEVENVKGVGIVGQV